jgi:hypothetical protein
MGAVAGLAIGLSLVAGSGLPEATAKPSELQVSFLPPGMLLHGEEVRLSAFATVESGEVSATGDLYVRGGDHGSFTRVRMSGDSMLTAKVPTSALEGSVLETYVVVTNRVSGDTVSVPASGRHRPYRSWIADDPAAIDLGEHRFGHVRKPEAVVVDADVGTGRGEVGIACPPEGLCDAPLSFDVGPDGTVWVADVHNSRLESWGSGDPGTAGRTIRLDYAPADLAVAPDGTIYVWGADAGVGMRVHAISPSGAERWSAPALTNIFNDHVRIVPGGAPSLRSSQFGWLPAVDALGDPITPDAQRRQAERDQPADPDLRLVVTSTCVLVPACDQPRDARVALVGNDGDLRAAWLVSGLDVMVDEPEDATPAVVQGDPVLVSALYDFDRHLKEYEVLRLGPGGSIADRFSLGRGVLNGDVAVTSVRVGPDGAVYQMQYDVEHPEAGMQIARYRLAGPSPSPSPTPTPTSTATTPTPSASTTSSASAGAPASAKEPDTAGGWPAAAWVGASLVGAAIVGAAVAAVWWRRRRARPPNLLGG